MSMFILADSPFQNAASNGRTLAPILLLSQRPVLVISLQKRTFSNGGPRQRP